MYVCVVDANEGVLSLSVRAAHRVLHCPRWVVGRVSSHWNCSRFATSFPSM